MDGARPGAAQRRQALPGLALVALVMVVAGLGFSITAVPFHFYAPDVYQGTDAGGGRAAGLRAQGGRLRRPAARARLRARLARPRVQAFAGQVLSAQVPILLWILAAVTMTLGNVLALLQDNLKRLLAYSSVAHAGYMLIGLAVAPTC